MHLLFFPRHCAIMARFGAMAIGGAGVGAILPTAGLNPSFSNTNRRRRANACLLKSTWIITSFDECWSGNILVASGRKTMVLLYTFDEVDRRVLTKSGAWLAFSVVQTRLYKECPGGWSQVARILLEHMFLSPTNGFQTVGATLTSKGRTVCLRASLLCAISDGAASNWTMNGKVTQG